HRSRPAPRALARRPAARRRPRQGTGPVPPGHHGADPRAGAPRRDPRLPRGRGPEALGLGVRAQVRITLDGKTPQKEKDVLKRLPGSPLVRSIYRVSGEDCFVAEVICRRIEDVNALLLDIQATRAMQSSRTAFVLETILDKGTLGPLAAALVAEGAAQARAA